MELLQDLSVELAVGVAAFVLGMIANRLARTWTYFRARNFWRPLATKDLAIVLGEGFSNLSSFEVSGLVGRGDLLASNEVIAQLSGMGLRRIRPEFADSAEGTDPTGRGLRRNLVIIGGQDANSIANECLQRLKCSYQLEDEDPGTSLKEPRLDGEKHLTFRPPRLRPSKFATGASESFRPTVVGGRVVRDYGVIVRTKNPFLFAPHQEKRVVLIYGCYGLGSYAAALHLKERAFLDVINNTDEDIECIVACDNVGGTPQAIRQVFVKHHDFGELCKADFLVDEEPDAGSDRWRLGQSAAEKGSSIHRDEHRAE